MTSSGPLRITRHLAAPNPLTGPLGGFSLLLEGPADELGVEIFTPAMTLVRAFRQEGNWAPGWHRLDLALPLANGHYYYRLQARRGQAESLPVMGSLLILR